MATTNSWSFPNMFDIARNKVSLVEDEVSVENRTRLLILTEPTELYMNPEFGVGLKRHLWKYNTVNEPAIIRDRIVEQLRLHEPCVDPEGTTVSNGLLSSDANNPIIEAQDANRLKLTVGLDTIFSDEPTELHIARDEMFGENWDTYIGGTN